MCGSSLPSFGDLTFRKICEGLPERLRERSREVKPELGLKSTTGDALDTAMKFEPRSEAFRRNFRIAKKVRGQRSPFLTKPSRQTIRECVKVHSVKMFKSFQQVGY